MQLCLAGGAEAYSTARNRILAVAAPPRRRSCRAGEEQRYQDDQPDRAANGTGDGPEKKRSEQTRALNETARASEVADTFSSGRDAGFHTVSL